MASSYTQAALVAQVNAKEAAQAAQTVPVADKIPASLARYIDVEAEIPVTTVQLDGLTVMKIIKHSREATGTAAGLLLGLDFDGTLEVSNSFPLPVSGDGDERTLKTSSGRYEATVQRALKDIGYDDSILGFYQSTNTSSFLRQSLLNTQAAHHEILRQGGVAVVHDLSQSTRGNVAFKAFRLTKQFLAAHKAGKFHTHSLLENGLTFSTMLEEIPLTIRTSPLLSAFLPTLSSPQSSSATTISPLLSAPTQYSLAKNLESLIEGLESHRTEENNVAFQQRQLTRERQRIESQAAKRKEENALRVSQGLTALPEEDTKRLLEKVGPGAEPSRLDTSILLGQVDALAKSAELLSAEGIVKSYASLA